MTAGMDEVLSALKAIAQNQTELLAGFDDIAHRVSALEKGANGSAAGAVDDVDGAGQEPTPLASPLSQASLVSVPADAGTISPPASKSLDTKSAFTSRIVLTTYPKQIGIKPLPMEWGAADPLKRGPVTVLRVPSTIRKRNAIGAHGGSYSIYYALAVASNELKADHKPDFTNTEPAVNIGPFPQWADKKKIVSMDPWGHVVPQVFKDLIEKDNGMLDLRPTIAVTKAHMKLSELEDSVRSGRLVPDGKVCLNASGELAVTKFAVEPVWYLPGVAERFGIDEGTLRRSLFEHTGGMYPECNGSDVFGSDICTCRPYLIFGIEEAVKEAQNGGTGVVIYFRKEGRALGEVTKYLVYNARKRGEDRASDYFKRTENIAGVKDMRFQALMPDILHWLGITKIDRMLSMSNMKHDAIVSQGIPIHERVELPESWIPADSRVEIDAKITAGYFTTGHRMTDEELRAVQGRIWEE
ncbi:GTP cyclohydrolase N terminal-domain-containing protein [Lasiosphaeria miniovina]|uniref:GTP cyclohydrolase N terminal-domain-containing protein n=1 Tax=Lasiosphaeria miniovina TaxID=1954250 RepID=A0AA40B5C4_9PEZI|nr:GTP cyclohydrolase N terminal-domain-containing protein [Lasiosphaeria miniovina]KAK0728009.1 GTP cyclohydrolase N terminal-domain-containing protein [Lasiosphaeria miniovina]